MNLINEFEFYDYKQVDNVKTLMRLKYIISGIQKTLYVKMNVEWGLGSQFCQPILLQTKCTGFYIKSNSII